MKIKILSIIIISLLILSCETLEGMFDSLNNNTSQRQTDDSTRQITATSPLVNIPESINANTFEWRVFLLTNVERENRGIPPLQWSNLLGAAARAHTEDMVRNNFLSHTGSDRSNLGQRITRAGFTWREAAENIAEGQRTPEEVINSWMNSPGHRANILNPTLTHIGVGFISNKWTQKFSTPR